MYDCGSLSNPIQTAVSVDVISLDHYRATSSLRARVFGRGAFDALPDVDMVA